MLCRNLSGIVLAGALILLRVTGLHADRLPVEPEADNEEYLLDLVTNAYNREWREIWDGGDNRLRFRLGSNNVREWFIEEELKFAASLNSRLRLRFYHSRLLYYTSKRRRFNTIEIEGRLSGDYYASFFGTPTYNKVDNSLGLMFQRRKAVNRYSLLFIEFPRFFNNFTEYHKQTSDTLLSVYSRQPVKVGIDVLEGIGKHILLRASGYVTNTYESVSEHVPSGKRDNDEAGRLQALSGWAEYASDIDGDPRRVDAWGLEFGIYRYEKWKPGVGAVPAPSASPVPGMTPASGPATAAGAGQVPGTGTLPFTGSSRSLPSMQRTPGDRPFIDFDVEPFTPLAGDTIRYARERKRFIEPYGWKVLGSRLTVRGSVRFDVHEIAWRNLSGRKFSLENACVVPSLGARFSLGAKGASVVEGGFVAEYRKRVEKTEGAGAAASKSKERFRDHRLLFAYEYRFRDDAVMRIVETIDLDREDWGQFSIHDHGFFQLIVGF